MDRALFRALGGLYEGTGEADTLVEARWYLAVGFRVGWLPFRWQGQGILQVQGLGEGGVEGGGGGRG